MRDLINKTLFSESNSVPANPVRPSNFAIISVSIPAIAFLLALAVVFLSPHDPDSGHMGLRDFYNAIEIVFFASIAGTVSGLISLARREPDTTLKWLGLLINGVPLLVMLSLIALHG